MPTLAELIAERERRRAVAASASGETVPAPPASGGVAMEALIAERERRRTGQPAPMPQPDVAPWGDGQAFDDLYARRPQKDPLLSPLRPEARTLTAGQSTQMKPPPAPRGPVMSPAQRRATQEERDAAVAKRTEQANRWKNDSTFGTPVDEMGMPIAVTDAQRDSDMYEVRDDVGKGIVASPIHAERALVGAAEATLNTPGDYGRLLVPAFAAGFDPTMQGIIAGSEFGVGADTLLERFAAASEAGGYQDMLNKLQAAPRFDFSAAKIPVPKEIESVSGALAEGLAQFLISRKLVGKVLPGGGLAAHTGKDAAAVFVGIDGSTGRLADIIPADKIPEGPLRDYFNFLKTQPDDSPLMGRFKNFLEDLTVSGPMIVPQTVVAPTARAVGNAINPALTPTNAGGARPGAVNTAAVQPPPTTAVPTFTRPQTAPPPVQPQAAAQGRFFDPKGDPVDVEVVAQGQNGGVIVRTKDGREVLVGEEILSRSARDPSYVVEWTGTGKPVSQMTDAELAAAKQRADEIIKARSQAGQSPLSYVSDRNAIVYETKRRASGAQAAAQAAPQAPPVQAGVTPPAPPQPPVAGPTMAAGAAGNPPGVSMAQAAQTPPPGTLTPAGNGVAVDSFNNLPEKTRRAVLRALESSGMTRQQAFDAIRSLNDLPPDRANMFEFELIRRFGGPDQFPNLQANLTAMGSDFSMQTGRKGGSPQEVMNKSLLDQAQSEGEYLTRMAENIFGEGKVATKQELETFRNQLGGQYRKQLEQTYPGLMRLRSERAKLELQAKIDPARKELTEYLLRPEVMEDVPQWVRDQVMLQVSDDLRFIRLDDAGQQFRIQQNPELAPLLTPDRQLRYSPQLWKTLVEMYPTQVGHSLQSAYRQAIDEAYSGISNAVDRTTAKRLKRMRGESRVRSNAADPNKRGYGLLHLIEQASPGYKEIRQEFGDVVGAQKAADMPNTFFRDAKDEEALANFIDVYNNELTPLQQEAVRNGITTQIRQALKNKTEFTQPWQLDAASRGNLPNLTAVSSQPFLEALPRVFGRDGERMADAIRLSRANIDNIQAINKNFASGTPKGIEIRENARNLYENKAAADITPIDTATSTMAGIGAFSALAPGGGVISAAALGGATLNGLYRAYKRGKSLTPGQKEALAEWLFKPRRATDAAPPTTPRRFSKIGYAGNVLTGAGVGAGAAAFTGQDPTTGAVAGALGGGLRAGLRAMRAESSIIKPPPAGGPRGGNRLRTGGNPPPPVGPAGGPQIVQNGWFGGGKKPPRAPKAPPGAGPRNAPVQTVTQPVQTTPPASAPKPPPQDEFTSARVRKQAEVAGKAMPSVQAKAGQALKNIQSAKDDLYALMNEDAQLASYQDALKAAKSARTPNIEEIKFWEEKIRTHVPEPKMQQGPSLESRFTSPDTPKPPVQSGFGGGRRLPMDEASRMARAREMGFDVDTVYYHGTMKDVDQFDPEKFGTNDYGWHGKGVYLATDPEWANTYSGMSKGFFEEGQRWRDKTVEHWNNLGKQPNVMPVYVRGKVAKTTNTSARIEDYPDADALLVDYGNGHTEMVVRDPSNIRGKFAKFDPSESSSSKLLAGTGANATGLGGAGGAVAGAALAPDTNGDGVIDAQELMAGGFGGLVSGLVAGAGANRLLGPRRGAAPKAGPKLPGRDANINAAGIKAYHGSPHDFDKFDSSKIGTGEGAQSYGHGLYFAESEGVARSYRDALKLDKRVNSATDRFQNLTIDGEPLGKAFNIDTSYVDELKTLINAGDTAGAKNFLAEKGARWKDLVNDPEYQFRDYAAEKVKAYDGLLSRLDQGGKLGDKGAGRLYEVDINADPEHFFDYDKPLGQQSQYVQDAFRKAGIGFGDGYVVDAVSTSGGYYARIETPTGQKTLRARVYKTREEAKAAARNQLWQRELIQPRADVSQRLREAGIPGIKYLDQGSRGAGDGTRNYVVFDDSAVKIINKQGFGSGKAESRPKAAPQKPPAQSGFGGGSPKPPPGSPPKAKPKAPSTIMGSAVGRAATGGIVGGAVGALAGEADPQTPKTAQKIAENDTQIKNQLAQIAEFESALKIFSDGTPEQIQAQLDREGFDLGPTGIDGTLGEITKAAIRGRKNELNASLKTARERLATLENDRDKLKADAAFEKTRPTEEQLMFRDYAPLLGGIAGAAGAKIARVAGTTVSKFTAKSAIKKANALLNNAPIAKPRTAQDFADIEARAFNINEFWKRGGANQPENLKQLLRIQPKRSVPFESKKGGSVVARPLAKVLPPDELFPDRFVGRKIGAMDALIGGSAATEAVLAAQNAEMIKEKLNTARQALENEKSEENYARVEELEDQYAQAKALMMLGIGAGVGTGLGVAFTKYASKRADVPKAEQELAILRQYFANQQKAAGKAAPKATGKRGSKKPPPMPPLPPSRPRRNQRPPKP